MWRVKIIASKVQNLWIWFTSYFQKLLGFCIKIRNNHIFYLFIHPHSTKYTWKKSFRNLHICDLRKNKKQRSWSCEVFFVLKQTNHQKETIIPFRFFLPITWKGSIVGFIGFFKPITVMMLTSQCKTKNWTTYSSLTSIRINMQLKIKVSCLPLCLSFSGMPSMDCMISQPPPRTL